VEIANLKRAAVIINPRSAPITDISRKLDVTCRFQTLKPPTHSAFEIFLLARGDEVIE